MDRLDEILTFFNQYGEVQTHGLKLPHWQQSGACYFVTFRLSDSVPQARLDHWKDERDWWLANHPEPRAPEIEREYHRLFSRKLDQWLDEGHGSCVLRRADIADILLQVLATESSDENDDAADTFRSHSWVIMPNHVHGLFSLRPGTPLECQLQRWKGLSARRINQSLGRTGTPLWQKSYFDRLIRDARHFRNVARYIRRNPANAHLPPGQFRLWESDLVRQVLDEE